MAERSARVWARWAEIDPLLEAALELAPEERRAFLECRSEGDRELLELLTTLLELEGSSERLEAFPAELLTTGPQALFGEDIPEVLGAYRIEREIGRGGMGTVYLGVRRENGIEQRAALKVLRRGVDTDDVIRRFARERHILAALTHPGIARFYDTGVSQGGRPFLAMEYIEGRPITEHCDRLRLGVDARLRLFVEVAQAVRAAHARLVVHRDLKPSNILVADGRVKLLDFGIAKLLDDESRHDTRTGQRLFTPEVASPEQLRGEPISTATDVYQLGILLFQLLVGRRPRGRPDGDPERASAALGHDDKARTAADRRASSVSALRRRLRGDLDTILHRALQPEPERRYDSVEQLAEDIRCHSKGHVISARPDTWSYRARKAAERHRWLAPASLVVLVSTLAYLVTVTQHNRELTEQRNAAEREARRAEEVQQFLVELFESADPYAPADPERGRRITVVEALDVGLLRVREELVDRPELRVVLLEAIADVYQNLGTPERALPLRREVTDWRSANGGASSREALESLGRLAQLQAEVDEMDVALGLAERRLELARELPASRRSELAWALVDLASIEDTRYELPAAERHLIEVLELDARGSLEVELMAEAQRTLSDVLRRLGESERAVSAAEKAWQLRRQQSGETSVPTLLARMGLAQSLGVVQRYREADQHFAQVIEGLEEQLGPDHRMTLVAVNNLAVARSYAGEHEGAERLYRRLVEARVRVHGEVSDMAGDAFQNLGTALASLGRLDEAEGMHERAAAIFRELYPPNAHKNAFPLLSLTGIHLEREEWAAAERRGRAALDVLRKTLPDGHYVPAIARCRIARALAGRGADHEAERLWDASLPILREPIPLVEYRAECLEAARDFFGRTGATLRANDVEQVLSSG